MSQLDIRYHRVDVTIDDQIATTRVDQVFYNPNEWSIEGTYIFPLPLDAVVSNFKLWIDGQAVDGKVLAADEARRVYEEIVISMRDPALLEYVGTRRGPGERVSHSAERGAAHPIGVLPGVNG